MSVVERRFEFIIHEDVQRDIFDMANENPDQAALVVAVIGEMKANENLCKILIDERNDDSDLDVQTFLGITK
jgi:hypothetical protein